MRTFISEQWTNPVYIYIYKHLLDDASLKYNSHEYMATIILHETILGKPLKIE
jgi:hypothetical protein